MAAALGIPRAAALRGLLFATRLGLFDLNWDVRCSACTGTPDYHLTLVGLRERAHCGLCQIEFDVDFEEQVEVTFTANPDVRRLSFKDFRDRVFPEHLEYFQAIAGREERFPYARAMCQPGETKRLQVDLRAGEYRYLVPGHSELGGDLSCEGPPSDEPQEVEITVDSSGAVTPRRLALRPGPVGVTVRFGYTKHWPLLVQRCEPVANWVSAAYVTSQQDFRDLFSGEFLAPGVSFAVRSTTLMFTDIRGSTELYEELGDARAYALVQDHFRVMTEEIRRHEGGIVKTIGDAVMAAFPVNCDAVRAACAIQERFAREPAPLAGVEVKIGLHRGPTIAVTSNRALDYFGRTVNVSARAQGQARPRCVVITDAVLDDPAVRALLGERGWPTERFDATLKGIGGAVALTSIAPS